MGNYQMDNDYYSGLEDWGSTKKRTRPNKREIYQRNKINERKKEVDMPIPDRKEIEARLKQSAIHRQGARSKQLYVIPKGVRVEKSIQTI